jgi:serine protease Do
MLKRGPVIVTCLLVGGLTGTLITGQVLQGQTPPQTTTIPKETGSYRGVVKTVLPAVVSIVHKSTPVAVKGEQPNPRWRQRFGDMPIPDEMRRFLEELEQNPTDPQPLEGFGSGFLVDPKGVILSNYHVVADLSDPNRPRLAKQVEVRLADGRKFVSQDIKGDRKTDLAIVRIHSDVLLPYLEMGDSDGMEIGDRVLAVGAPFGLTGSVTQGIVSAKGRNDLGMNKYEDFLQTDAAINPGNSGGPLVNLEGKVIAINSAIKTRTGGFQGVGLAISSNMAKNIMDQLLKDGVVHRGYLGVLIRDLDAELASRLGLKTQTGVYIRQATEGRPAAKAGIEDGDIITSVAGHPVKNGFELQKVVASLPVGKPTNVTVLRNSQSRQFQVTVEEQPEDLSVEIPRRAPARRNNRGGGEDGITLDKVGLEVSDLTPKAVEKHGLNENVKGVLITQVKFNSPAAVAQLREGMVIEQIDGRQVTTAKAAQEALEKASLAKGVLLKLRTPQGTTEYVLLRSE